MELNLGRRTEYERVARRPCLTPRTDKAFMYNHGIATLALCDAFLLTGDPALRGPAEKALRS